LIDVLESGVDELETASLGGVDPKDKPGSWYADFLEEPKPHLKMTRR